MMSNNSNAATPDVGGGSMMPSGSFFKDAIMRFFHWLAIPALVLMRRDLGERFLTNGIFFATLVVLSLFTFGGGLLAQWSQDLLGSTARGDLYYMLDGFSWFMVTVTLLYFVLGLLQFARQRWRLSINQPLHSYHGGYSRMKRFSAPVQWLLNAIFGFFVRLIGRLQGKGESSKLSDEFEVFPSTEAVAQRFVEPLFFILLAIMLSMISGGLAAIWSWYSALSLIIYMTLTISAQKEQALDIRDNYLESAYMAGAMSKPNAAKPVRHPPENPRYSQTDVRPTWRTTPKKRQKSSIRRAMLPKH